MNKKKETDLQPGKISRRKALSKFGIVAFSGATMLLLLNKPGKAQANDTSDEFGFPGDPGNF